jgi:hypothetical protein
MVLTEIINTYKTKSAQNSQDARDFILPQFFGDSVRILNRRYVGLFMCGDDGTGYDAINNRLYEVDPEVQSSDFIPENGQFVLFQKKVKVSDVRSASLKEQGMKPFVQQLQVVGSDEVLDSHIYEPENELAKKLMLGLYKEVVAFADMRVSYAKLK